MRKKTDFDNKVEKQLIYVGLGLYLVLFPFVFVFTHFTFVGSNYQYIQGIFQYTDSAVKIYEKDGQKDYFQIKDLRWFPDIHTAVAHYAQPQFTQDILESKNKKAFYDTAIEKLTNLEQNGWQQREKMTYDKMESFHHWVQVAYNFNLEGEDAQTKTIWYSEISPVITDSRKNDQDLLRHSILYLHQTPRGDVYAMFNFDRTFKDHRMNYIFNLFFILYHFIYLGLFVYLITIHDRKHLGNKGFKMFNLYQEPTVIPYIIAIFSLLTTFFIWFIPALVYQNITYISQNKLISFNKVIGFALIITFINWLGLTFNFYIISLVYLYLVYLSSKKIEQKSLKWINISMLLFMYFIVGVYSFFNYKLHYITYVFFSSNDIVNYQFNFKPYFKVYHVGDFLGSVSFTINNQKVTYTNEPIQYRIYMFYYFLHFIGLSIWSFIYFDVLKKHKFSYYKPYKYIKESIKQKDSSAINSSVKNELKEDSLETVSNNPVNKTATTLEKNEIFSIDNKEKIIKEENIMTNLVDLLTKKLSVTEKTQFELRESLLSIKEKEFDLKKLKYELETHPVFKSLKRAEDLQYFMTQHVYAVWDFMSLLKRLQKEICCVEVPWIAPSHANASRLINEIVLGEESDQLPDGNYISHFDLYLLAMNDLKADTKPVLDFITSVKNKGFDSSVEMIPEPARTFVKHTMNIALKGSIAANLGSFFNGRESVIPGMFTTLLKDWQIDEQSAPMFHYYLVRHIELDGDEHGPAGERLIQLVIGENTQDYIELLDVSISSIQSRIKLWDEVLIELKKRNTK